MEVKRYTTSDGRRIEDRVVKNELPDGQIEHVVETREEMVPMKVTRKVTQKMATVPVEEKVELFGDDGSVETSVKSVSPSALGFNQSDVSLRDVVNRLDNLAVALQKPVQPKRDFVAKLKAVALPDESTAPTDSNSVLSIAMWAVAAAVALLIGYSALM